MKKVIAAVLLLAVLLSFTACGKKDNPTPSTSPSTTLQPQSDATATAKEIYFLNFKPEVGRVYEEIAREYEAQTGVRVKVVTAASDTYEQTLTSEIAKSNPPTNFQINGPIGYENWKNYCADLKDTKLYSILSDKELAITNGDGVYGIPYVIEGYGIIYNEENDLITLSDFFRTGDLHRLRPIMRSDCVAVFLQNRQEGQEMSLSLLDEVGKDLREAGRTEGLELVAAGGFHGLKRAHVDGFDGFIHHFADHAEGEHRNGHRAGKGAQTKDQRRELGNDQRGQGADDVEQETADGNHPVVLVDVG